MYFRILIRYKIIRFCKGFNRVQFKDLIPFVRYAFFLNMDTGGFISSLLFQFIRTWACKFHTPDLNTESINVTNVRTRGKMSRKVGTAENVATYTRTDEKL